MINITKEEQKYIYYSIPNSIVELLQLQEVVGAKGNHAFKGNNYECRIG
jgi:hypothetical protein